MGTPIEGGEVQGEISPTGESAPGPNPAWNDVLSVLPESFHGMVTPHFQKWDQAAQSRVEAANEQLKSYEGYQPFVEHGIDPTELQNGLRLMHEINTNPQAVWDALGRAYGLANGTEVEDDGADGDEGAGTPNLQDPRFGELQQGLELVSQIVLQEQQAKANLQADSELDAELTSLKSKFPDYDERFVLAMMQNGMSADQAGQAWQDTRNSLLESNPRPFAPNVMGGSQGGSGYPSQQVDPVKMSSKEARNTVVEMLRAAAEHRN